jgi:hypothetical protein
MKNVITMTLAALLAAAITPSTGTLHAAPDGARAAAGTVTVTVTYKGKGTVDSSHKLWVWLFDSPNIGAGSMPIAQMALDKNGSDAVFDGIAGDAVYVAAAFDEQGVMSGDGPPPTGSPIGVIAGKEGAPSPVKPGDKSAATLVFDDSFRMP